MTTTGGDWVDEGYGTLGYVLINWNGTGSDESDLSSIPCTGPVYTNGTAYSRGQDDGNDKYLEEPSGGSTRKLGGRFSGTPLVDFTFTSSWSGRVWVYVCDDDEAGRSQDVVIKVNGVDQLVQRVGVGGDFYLGQWVGVDVNVPSGQVLRVQQNQVTLTTVINAIAFTGAATQPAQEVVTVETTPTELVGAGDVRLGRAEGVVYVYNESTTDDLFVGDSSVTTSTGTPIAAESVERFRGVGELYGIVASGTVEARVLIR